MAQWQRPRRSTRAIEALTAAALSYHPRGEHDPAARAFGEETVEKPGIDPTQAFKTLMVRLEPTGEFVVGCVPALAYLSMAGRRAAGARAPHGRSGRRAAPHRLRRGGISPLGQTTRIGFH